MKSKIQSVFLTFIIAALIVVCIAALLTLNHGVAFAADAGADYPVCGDESVHESGTAIDSDYFSEDSKYTLSAGNYFLNLDVSLSRTLTVSAETVLCLNGHKLEYVGADAEVAAIAIEVRDGGALTICDCNKSGGKHNYIVQNGKYIFGNVSDEKAINGGVVCGGEYAVSVSGGTLKVYGGAIAGANRGIYISEKAEVYVYGGIARRHRARVRGRHICGVRV